MKKIFQKFKNHKYRNLICMLGLVLVFIILPRQVYALTEAILKGIIDGILYGIGEFFGFLVTLLIGFLMKVAAYNDFTTSEAVRLGWKLMRDVCNMFFIVILMVIAICTIIRVEAYNYKKMLPTLLVKAVLINFSLLFCGLLIDASQVVTLTFVGAFKDAGVGNFITGLGINKIYAASTSGNPSVGTTSTLFYGILLLALATVVIAALVFVFLGRIIAFWILIVLSPFAFLASASGGVGSKYSEQWWSEFTKYLLVGPVLAFFLWLSLSIMRGAALGAITGTMSSGLPSVGFSEAGTSDNFVAFCISMAMLYGSLVAAQQIGTAWSGAAGKVMSGAKKGAWGATKFAGRRWDDWKYGGKGLTKYGGKLVHGIFRETRLGQMGEKLYKYGGAQIRTIPGAVKDSFEGFEKKSILRGRGAMGEAMDRLIRNEETYKYQQVLGQEKAEKIKELENAGFDANTDALLHVYKEAKKKNDQALCDATVDLLFRHKDEDAFVDAFAQNATKDQLDKMGWKIETKDGAEKAVGNFGFKALSVAMRESGISAQQAIFLSELLFENGGIKGFDMAGIDDKTGKAKYNHIKEDGSIDEEGQAVLAAKKAASAGAGFANKVPGRHFGTVEREVNRITGKTKTRNVSPDSASRLIQSHYGSALERAARVRPELIRTFLQLNEEELADITPEDIDNLNNRLDKFEDEKIINSIFLREMPASALGQINAAKIQKAQRTGKEVKLLRLAKRGDKYRIEVAPAAGTSTTPPPTGSIMSDVNKKKYDKTQEKIKEYKDLDFYISDDYERNKEQYYDHGTMERITRTKEEEERKKEKFTRTKEKEEEYRKKNENFYESKEYLADKKKKKREYYAEETMRQKTLIDPATGRDRMDTLTGTRSAKAKGQNGESVALGINAQNDKLQGLIREGAAGVCLIGEDKERAIEQIGAFYADQLKAQNEQLEDAQKLSDEQMQAEVDSLKNSLGQASSLRLINKNREGYDAKSVLRHELMHDRIESADQGKLKGVWDSMDEKTKDEINKRIRSEWVGGENLKDEQVRNEYFAEGAANFGRKDTAGGIQLEAGQARVLQQAGVKMKGAPEEEEDIKVEKMSRRALGKEAGEVRKKEKAEAKETAKQEKIKARDGKRIVEEPKLSEEQELGNAKTDAQNKLADYRQKATDRENKQKEFENRKLALNRSKKEAEQIKQQAIQREKDGKTNESQTLLSQYNSKVESIKGEERKVNQIPDEIKNLEFKEIAARNQAQESSRNYTAKENVVKARGVDGQIKEWQAKRDSTQEVYNIEVPKSKTVKVPKIDFDKQISDLRRKRGDLATESVRAGRNNPEIENIDSQISELQAQKASQPKESAEPASGGFQKVDINKEIRDLQNTIRGLKEGLKNPAKNDGEKDSMRKDLGASNIKLNVLKDQKNRAIEQQIQELNQTKAGLGQSQRNIEQSKFSASKMEVAPAPASKSFSAEEFVKETSAQKETPPVYQVDETHNQEVVNNVTNVINAAEGGGLKELQNAMTNSLASPAGRYWIIKAMQKGMSDMPNNIKGLLSPDFANLVSDDEKAVQDKELAEKMKNYIGDVKIALGELGKKD